MKSKWEWALCIDCHNASRITEGEFYQVSQHNRQPDWFDIIIDGEMKTTYKKRYVLVGELLK